MLIRESSLLLGWTLAVVAAAAISTGLAGPASLSSGEAAAAAPDPRPNIILITTDEQRHDELWAMPTVQHNLVQQGTSFTKSYASFPLCCPSRATWLTGQYAHNHGVLGNAASPFPLGGFPAFDNSSTLATWLHDAGYQTAFVGKFLNKYGIKPVRKPPGWDDWHANVGGGNYFDTRVWENGTPFQYTGPYQVDLHAGMVENVIKQRVPADAPLFLWASYFAPHNGLPREPGDPLTDTPAVAPRHVDRFVTEKLRTSPSFNEADVSDKPSYVRNRALITPFAQKGLTNLYQQRLESLLAVDEAIARMISALAATGELDNTVIVFTSDNGYTIGEHRIPQGKAVPYEPSTRVPLVVRGPGFPPSATRSQLVANIDLAPTMVELADAQAGLPMDGTSLLPMAADPAADPGRDLVLEAGPRTVDGPWYYTAVRTSKWLYVEYPETGEVELYDMVNDPYQLQNRAADQAYATQLGLLANRLAQLRDCAGETCR